jgi:hypothetical protein
MLEDLICREEIGTYSPDMDTTHDEFGVRVHPVIDSGESLYEMDTDSPDVDRARQEVESRRQYDNDWQDITSEESTTPEIIDVDSPDVDHAWQEVATPEIIDVDSPDVDRVRQEVATPEIVDVDSTMEELYPSVSESIPEVLHTFRLFMNRPQPEIGRVCKYNSEVFVGSLSTWVTMIDKFARAVDCEIHTVHHATSLFLNFIHRDIVCDNVSIETRDQWKTFHWHRIACMWIALKYSDSDFDDVSLIVTNDDNQKLLISAEMEVMRVVNHELAPPPDYISMLGVLLGVPEQIMDAAVRLYTTVCGIPSEWYNVPYVTISAACIVVAKERTDGRPEVYVRIIQQLNIIDTPRLLELSERILKL